MANQPATTAPAAGDKATLDQAFEALKTFDWGSDRAPLGPIDDAVIATRGDAAARNALEARVAAVLGSGLSRAAKDFACRTLTVIGTAELVSALAPLLTDADLSHMARYALERMPVAEAAAALRAALPKVAVKLKIGVNGSLGERRDEASVPLLTPLLAGGDTRVAAAAAAARGDIGSPAAAAALCSSLTGVSAAVQPAVADGAFHAAERLLADGNYSAARNTYQALLGSNPSKAVRVAATRGLLIVKGKKA